MNFRKQGVRREGDDAAALCDGVRIHTRACPQSSEAEHILIVRVNIVWLFTCVRIDMPFIKAQCRNNAAAPSFPGLSRLSAARQALDRDIEAAGPGESPVRHDALSFAVVGANNGNRLPRGCVEIRREY